MTAQEVAAACFFAGFVGFAMGALTGAMQEGGMWRYLEKRRELRHKELLIRLETDKSVQLAKIQMMAAQTTYPWPEPPK